LSTQIWSDYFILTSDGLYRKPQRPLASNRNAWTILFPMQDAHPSDCLGIADLAEINLGGFQEILLLNNI